jgi:hypothetical protein
LAFVSLVLSGLLVFTFAGEKPSEPIEILRNQYPQILPLGKSTFGFSMVARNEFERVELRFAILVPRDLLEDELIDPERQFDEGSLPDDILNNVERLSWFVESTSNLGIEPDAVDRTIVVEGREYDLVVEDYSDILARRLGPDLLGRNVTANVPLAYAAMANGTHYQYLEGSLDFFVKPTVNIRSLMVAHNDNETRYIPDDDVWEGSDNLPISRAPRGVIGFESVEADDTITVVIEAEPLQFPAATEGPVALMQMVQVYLDGQPYGDPIINPVRIMAVIV